MGEDNSIWSTLCFNGRTSHRVMTLAATIYWNVWFEKNKRIFNSDTRSFHIYCRLIMHDFILWIYIPSNEKRVYISGGSSDDDLGSPGQVWFTISYPPLRRQQCLAALRERHGTLFYFFVLFSSLILCKDWCNIRITCIDDQTLNSYVVLLSTR